MSRVLKQDLFGSISRSDDGTHVIRDTSTARRGLGGLARHLAKREARALGRLADLPGVPRLVSSRRGLVIREWIEAAPMQQAKPRETRYYREALRLLRALHARGIVHNDLAKEPNWLVTPEGLPALVDFQLAMYSPRRGRLFMALAHDDLRHLLKHKRSYLPAQLTSRQLRILATPSLVTRVWRASGKRIYTFVTRRLLRWADREGAGDRTL